MKKPKCHTCTSLKCQKFLIYNFFTAEQISLANTLQQINEVAHNLNQQETDDFKRLNLFRSDSDIFHSFL